LNGQTRATTTALSYHVVNNLIHDLKVQNRDMIQRKVASEEEEVSEEK
jgi:hypothetical protein